MRSEFSALERVEAAQAFSVGKLRGWGGMGGVEDNNELKTTYLVSARSTRNPIHRENSSTNLI